MASVRLDLMDAKQGRLPPVCICCGEPTQKIVEHRFYYQPTWLIVCNLILPAVVRWCLAYDSVVIPVPVCSRHGWRLNLPTLMGYILAAVLLLMVPVLLFLSISQYYDALLGLGLVALLLVLVTLPAILVTQLMTPRAYSISDLFVGLTSVSDEFAGSSRRGGGLLAGSSSYGASAGYGQLQPAYSTPPGYSYPAPAGGSGSLKLALIVGGAVLGVILLTVTVIAGVAFGVRNMMQPSPIAALPPQPASTVPSATPSSPPASFSSPAIPSIAPGSSFTPPIDVSSFTPPEDKPADESKSPAPAATAAAATTPPTDSPEIDTGPAKSSSTPPAPRRGGPNARRRRPSTSRSAPPEGEQPVAPLHALDLRTQKVIFPPNHVPIPTNFALVVGQEVWARQHEGAFWHAAFVAEVDGDSVTVRYKGWSDFFNETMSRDMLCIEKAALGAAGKANSSASRASTTSDGGATGKLRTWTDITGKFKVEAELVKVENGMVTLRKANGDKTTLPVARLSEADRKFLGEDSFGK